MAGDQPIDLEEPQVGDSVEDFEARITGRRYNATAQESAHPTQVRMYETKATAQRYMAFIREGRVVAVSGRSLGEAMTPEQLENTARRFLRRKLLSYPTEPRMHDRSASGVRDLAMMGDDETVVCSIFIIGPHWTAAEGNAARSYSPSTSL